MAMIITYEVGNSLYFNITNRCSNACEFCVRNHPGGMNGLDLWLEREPEFAEILAELEERNLTQYNELVFCGFGEPLFRLNDILAISKWVKKRFAIPIRINTNGQGSLIAGRDITVELAGVIDAVSISLNAKNPREYQALCHSDYREEAFFALLEFAAKSKQYIPKVVLSVVDVMPAEDIADCRKIAAAIGVPLKVRTYVA